MSAGGVVVQYGHALVGLGDGVAGLVQRDALHVEVVVLQDVHLGPVAVDQRRAVRGRVDGHGRRRRVQVDDVDGLVVQVHGVQVAGALDAHEQVAVVRRDGRPQRVHLLIRVQRQVVGDQHLVVLADQVHQHHLAAREHRRLGAVGGEQHVVGGEPHAHPLGVAVAQVHEQHLGQVQDPVHVDAAALVVQVGHRHRIEPAVLVPGGERQPVVVTGDRHRAAAHQRAVAHQGQLVVGHQVFVGAVGDLYDVLLVGLALGPLPEHHHGLVVGTQRHVGGRGPVQVDGGVLAVVLDAHQLPRVGQPHVEPVGGRDHLVAPQNLVQLGPAVVGKVVPGVAGQQAERWSQGQEGREFHLRVS